MKYHIKTVRSNPAVRKDGTPVLSKSGKTLYSVGIKTVEFGDTWLNGLMPFNPDRWEGTEQELEVTDKEVNGKVYKNFNLPPREEKKEDVGQGQVAFTLQHILQTVKQTQADVEAIRKHLIEGKPIQKELTGRDYPTGAEEGIDPSRAGMTDEEADRALAELAEMGRPF